MGCEVLDHSRALDHGVERGESPDVEAEARL